MVLSPQVSGNCRFFFFFFCGIGSVTYCWHAGYAVIVARDGAEALRHVSASRPDLVVLDLGLPGVDGLEVARTIRASSSLPIIMVTARVAEGDRLTGLDSGADDYMTKPFSPRELVARVKAVLRRSQPRGTDVSGRRLRLGDLAVDLERLTVTRNGEAIDLSGTEFRLLATLARHPGRVFTRAQLLDAIGDARRRVVQSRRRRACEEPAPQDRARFAAAALRVDDLWRRLQGG